MAENMRDPMSFARAYLDGLKDVIDNIDLSQIAGLTKALAEAYENDRQVFVAGNGGSAATASHMASDLAKTALGKDLDPRRKRFRILALTDNIPLITAWGNDVSFDEVFGQQLLLFGRPGDLLVVITGSGNSPNILRAVDTAKRLQLKTFGLLGGSGGKVMSQLDGVVLIPHTEYGYIEDLHMVLDHLVTAYFKMALPGVERME